MHQIVEQELLIEKVIAYITPYLFGLPVEHKPTYIHSIRVGLYLYEKGYDMDIVCAGFLHDLIEDSEIMYEDLIRDWGEEIADMVLANTSNRDLSREQRSPDLMQRAASHSHGSVIIKAADLLDGLKHYQRTGDITTSKKPTEKAKRLVENVKWDDEVFGELRKLLTKD